MKKKVVAFGEIMLRLEPPGYTRLVQANELGLSFGGAEANALVTLANFVTNTYFVTKLPKNPLGLGAANSLRRFGVNMDYIQWGGERMGIYFTENGASQRSPQVFYDRSHSAIAEVEPSEFAWEEILTGKDWFHFTGITPALGEGPARATLEAVKCAKKLGLTVSCDLNFRSKLWSMEQAAPVMSELMELVDVAVGIGELEAEKIFGIKLSKPSDSEEDTLRLLAEKLCQRFNLKHFALTLRKSHSASDNDWSAFLYDGQDFYFSRQYQIRIVDRIGTGDAFTGALIHGLLEGFAPAKAIEFATAAACLKHSIPGDYNLITVEEVEELLTEGGSGRVRR